MLCRVFERERKGCLKAATELREIVTQLVEEEGFARDVIETELYLNMRFEGTDAPMMVKEPSKSNPSRSFMNEFRDRFRAEYGFVMENREAIVDDDVRVRGVAKSDVNLKVSGGKGSGAEIRKNSSNSSSNLEQRRNRRRRRTLKARKAGQKRPCMNCLIYTREMKSSDRR